MVDKKEIDDVTGVELTGHVWDDDLRELNEPLPKWWLWVLYASIIWSVGYWIAYPAWPTASGYTKGLFGYSQRTTVSEEIATANQAQAKFRQAIASAELETVRAEPELLSFSIAGGRASFGDNCAPCHGRGAQGFIGYPNLNDDVWIWGGKLADIHKTILFGIRSGHPETRDNAMPRYGLEQLLTKEQINELAETVLAFANNATDKAAAERGKAIFAEQCVSCHGDEGKGNQELGAPDLTDAIWLYGGTKVAIVTSISTGRGGVMPAWNERLDPVTIKQLTVYVHSLGGGQ
ncbi:MAG: cytochrome-c oxidase, cbb3-type subunit III [Hyphomicrobiaceae bacterium]